MPNLQPLFYTFTGSFRSLRPRPRPRRRFPDTVKYSLAVETRRNTLTVKLQYARDFAVDPFSVSFSPSLFRPSDLNPTVINRSLTDSVRSNLGRTIVF
jgi:hypothetical protein